MLSPSVVALLISNLIPVAGVIFWGWSLAELIFLYWFENLIIGFYTIVKIFLSRSPSIEKFYASLFFWMFFGALTFEHGEILKVIFQEQMIFTPSLLISVLATCISHGVSLFQNYLRPKFHLVAIPLVLMFSPMPRLLLMHLMVTVSSAVVMVFLPLIPLLLFTLIKTVGDLTSHLFEHRSGNTYVLTPLGVSLFRRLFPKLKNKTLLHVSRVANDDWEDITKHMNPTEKQKVEGYFDSQGFTKPI